MKGQGLRVRIKVKNHWLKYNSFSIQNEAPTQLKIVMCKNEQKPELEPCYEKRAPEAKLQHFYDGSAALVPTPGPGSYVASNERLRPKHSNCDKSLQDVGVQITEMVKNISVCWPEIQTSNAVHSKGKYIILGSAAFNTADVGPLTCVHSNSTKRTESSPDKHIKA